MKKIILMIIVSISSSHLYSKESNTDTKALMQDAFYSLTQLLPVITYELDFTNPNNHKLINTHLNRMVESFKKGNHQTFLQSPTLKPNLNSLQENLKSSLLNFNNSNKAFSRLRLIDATNLCVSCHTQLSNDKVFSPLLNSETLIRKVTNNKYQLGNLYFILKDYNSAITAYTNFLKSKLKTKDEYYNKYVFESFFKSVYITAKVYSSPKKTIDFLNNLKKQMKLPNYILSEHEVFYKRALYWQSQFDLDNKELSKPGILQTLTRFEKKINSKSSILSGEFDYDLMILSGILSKSLLSKKLNNDSIVLYWMGIAEYRLGKSIFLNIGDLYLKKCIKKDPKTDIAKRCFKALEDETKFRFTGTSGTKIPESISSELKDLKKLL